MVCEVCINALHSGHQQGLASIHGVDNPYVVIAHHKDLSSLAKSASEACQICLRLWDAISYDVKRRLPAIVKERTAEDGTIPPGKYLTTLTFRKAENTWLHSGRSSMKNQFSLNLSFNSGLDRISDELPSDIFFVLQRCDDLNSHPVPFHSSSTSSDEAMTTAATWINKCVTSHQVCRDSCTIDANWYPTRLLDLAAFNTTDDIRVIETAKHRPTGPYMTLSHCWGSAQFIKLRKSPLPQFSQSIPISGIPKTFRDAIVVARQFGIRYLWIDSLCILQDEDDNSDWLRESSSMRKIYSRSYCNISALTASDTAQGLFSQRDPRISDSKVNVWVRDLGVEGDYVDCDVIENQFWRNNVSECPINKRGWVLQERMLAPRVLHFGREQLFWECKELDAAETFPKGLPSFLQLLYFTNFKDLCLDTRNKEIRADSWREYTPETGYYELWHILVYAYSSGGLTKASDKLIALSGLAKEFADITRDTYVAGMWRKYLESALLWRVVEPDGNNTNHTSRPLEYRAPSFSWASIDGMVVFPQTTEVGMLIKVVDVQLDFVTDDITGLVRGGYLDLKGQLKPFQMTQTMDGRPIQPRILGMEVGGINIKPPSLRPWVGLVFLLDVDQDGFQEENSTQALYYMPAARNLQPFGRHLQILLFKLVSREDGTFRRIGIAKTDDEEDIEVLLREIPNAADLPCREYGDGTHTIRVL